MNTFAKTRVVLWLALLFAGGAIFGCYVSTCLACPSCAPSGTVREPERNWRARRMESLRRALNLTDGQVREMAPAFDKAEASLRRLREETAARAREIVKANGKELMPLLTAEQQEKFRRWVAEQTLSMAPAPCRGGSEPQSP